MKLFWIFFLFLWTGCGSAGAVLEDSFLENGQEDPSSEIELNEKSVAITGVGGSVVVDAGYKWNGDGIEIPTGFVMSQCKFTASTANIDGQAISTFVSVDTVSSATEAFVICEKVVQERTEVPAQTKNCMASFTMICTQ